MPLIDADGLIEDLAAEPLAIPGETPPAQALEQVANAPLVALVFSSGADGRGFSLARALREAGYKGRLHARGELIPDQFAYALRCGFDAVEIGEERLARQPEGQWQAAARAFTYAYQGANSIFDRRRAARS